MFANGEHRIGMYATTDIAPQSELFFDYGYDTEIKSEHLHKRAIKTEWMQDGAMANQISTHVGREFHDVNAPPAAAKSGAAKGRSGSGGVSLKRPWDGGTGGGGGGGGFGGGGAGDSEGGDAFATPPDGDDDGSSSSSTAAAEEAPPEPEKKKKRKYTFSAYSMFLKDGAVREQAKAEVGYGDHGDGDASFADVSRAMAQRWASINAENGPALQRYQTAAKKAVRQFEKAEKKKQAEEKALLKAAKQQQQQQQQQQQAAGV